MDVEDHIINGHATHFMAALASVYRKQKNREEAEKLKKEELTPVQDWDEEHRRSEKRTLEQVIQEAKEAREQEAQEQLARERMIKEQAAYLASLKGNNQASSASQILQRWRRISSSIILFIILSRFALAPGLGQLPSLAPNLPYAGGSNKVAIPRQGQQGRSSPGTQCDTVTSEHSSHYQAQLCTSPASSCPAPRQTSHLHTSFSS